MSQHYIATKLHKVLDAFELGDVALFQRAPLVPHYVVDPSLLELLNRSDCNASILAMIEAEICYLPFPELLLEIPSDNHTAFVLLKDVGGSGLIAALDVQIAWYEPDRGRIATNDTTYKVATVRQEWIGPYEEMRGQKLSRPNGWIDVPAGKSASALLIAGKGPDDPPEDLNLVTLAVQTALLMLNIQGVDKEVIEPTRLNRARHKSGKPAVPRHTVIRIAHVYDRSGKRHDYQGGHMPVHWRSAYTRRQHYGVGNVNVKLVFIPSCLVNFKPGDEVPIPTRIIAA